MIKICKKCGKEKDEVEFARINRNKSSICKKCHSTFQRERYRPESISLIPKGYTQKQYEVLSLVSEYENIFNRFPTYQELANHFDTSRQDIDICISDILKKAEKLKMDRNKIDQYVDTFKDIINGEIVFTVYIRNGKVTGQKLCRRRVNTGTKRVLDIKGKK